MIHPVPGEKLHISPPSSDCKNFVHFMVPDENGKVSSAYSQVTVAATANVILCDVEIVCFCCCPPISVH